MEKDKPGKPVDMTAHEDVTLKKIIRNHFLYILDKLLFLNTFCFHLNIRFSLQISGSRTASRPTKILVPLSILLLSI